MVVTTIDENTADTGTILTSRLLASKSKQLCDNVSVNNFQSEMESSSTDKSKFVKVSNGSGDAKNNIDVNTTQQSCAPEMSNALDDIDKDFDMKKYAGDASPIISPFNAKSNDEARKIDHSYRLNSESPASSSVLDESSNDISELEFAGANVCGTPAADWLAKPDDSFSTHSDEYSMLPKEIIDEERKLAQKTEHELNVQAQAAGRLEEKEKEKRYKTLMMLLGKSSQYAVYMSDRLLKDKENSSGANNIEKPAVALETATTSTSTNKKPTRNSKRKSSCAAVNASKKSKKNDEQRVDEKQQTSSGLYYRNEHGLVVSRRQPKFLKGGVLRDYQLDGLDWMTALYKNAVNGILADEMGLGKTIQVIALLCHLREKNIFGPHLIIGPLSTLPNWMLEFANFAPDIPVVLFHGTASKRDELKIKIAKILSSKIRENIPVILTSYEMPLYDKTFFHSIRWCHTIVDEGHRLKNYKCSLGRVLRTYQTESRLLLTGTPLQNNLTELWSLLNYLIPEIFDDLPVFENLFAFSDLSDSQKQDQLIKQEKEEQIVSKMHQILEPFLLRRMKSDVDIKLPRKKEVLVYAPLTTLQEELYKSTLDGSIRMMRNPNPENDAPIDLADGKRRSRRCVEKNTISYDENWDIDEKFDYIPKDLFSSGNWVAKKAIIKDGIEYVYNIKLQNPGMMLRKIANHPYLVRTPVEPGTRNIIIDENLIMESGKLLVFDALMPKLKSRGHKVLLFSTFKIMLNLVEDYIIMRGYKYVRLDGDYSLEERLVAIKQFNSDPDTFIFLISTRAGGLGINLTAADTVIIYDSDWNPQVDLQAQDRCHRIGQTKPVVVYRLVTSGTIDQRIVDIATAKRRLEKLVVKKGKFQLGNSDSVLSIPELQELFKSTDYKKVIHSNGLVISNKQIDELLDRSDLLDDDESENNL